MACRELEFHSRVQKLARGQKPRREKNKRVKKPAGRGRGGAQDDSPGSAWLPASFLTNLESCICSHDSANNEYLLCAEAAGQPVITGKEARRAIWPGSPI
nr:uncharacterized protein LOC100612826 isoform X2 [Pan troglodytes]